jgi:hypothetical protein
LGVTTERGVRVIPEPSTAAFKRRTIFGGMDWEILLIAVSAALIAVVIGWWLSR